MITFVDSSQVGTEGYTAHCNLGTKVSKRKGIIYYITSRLSANYRDVYKSRHTEDDVSDW